MTDREWADGVPGDQPGAPEAEDDTEIVEGDLDDTEVAEGDLDDDTEVAEGELVGSNVDEEADEVGEAEDSVQGLETLDQMIGDDLTRVAAERDEYLDSLLRLQADFDNYRKRASRQQQDLSDRASEHIIAALLPVLDALDLAEAHAAASDDTTAESLTQIGTLFRETLRREGLERIDEAGVAFDPTVHDAVAHEAADEGDTAGPAASESESEDAVNAGNSGNSASAARAGDAGRVHGPSISGVLRAGYRLKGRVLRPAMVKVKG